MNFEDPNSMVESISDAFGLDEDEERKFRINIREYHGNELKSERIEATAEKYSENYGNKLSELSELLRVDEKSLGDDVWNLLEGTRSDILAEDAEKEIDQILEAESETGFEEDINKVFDGKYQQAAEQAYSELEGGFRKIAGLADISDGDIDLESFDAFKWMKDKQYSPHWDQEIDVTELTKRLRSQVETQIRSKTLDAIDAQARHWAESKYIEIIGEEPDLTEEELIHGIRAWKMTQDSDTLEKIETALRHNRESYFHELSPAYSKDEMAKLEQPELETLTKGIGRKKYSIGNREVEIHVASPLEAIKHGEAFDTCQSLTWEEGENTNGEPLSNLTSLRHPMVYARDSENNVVGRAKLTCLYEEDMSPLQNKRLRGAENGAYTGLETQELNRELEEAISDYRDKMSLKMGATKNPAQIDQAARNYEDTGEWFAPDRFADRS